MADRERGWRDAPNPLMPQRPKQGRTYTVKHIFIQADQLFYDVDAVTGLMDRANQQQTKVATSEDDTYRPMFFRWFDEYIAKTENVLSAFVLKKEKVNNINGIKEWNEKEITLFMPDYWDATVYDSLTQAIHQFIVAGALYKYCSLMLTSKDPRTVDYYQQTEEYSDTVRALACRVVPGALSRPLKPF